MRWAKFLQRRLWRHIKPTPTLRFLAEASSASLSMRREVGPSAVSGFSMNTWSPFWMAYAKWTQPERQRRGKNGNIARLQAIHRVLIGVESDEPALRRHVHDGAIILAQGLVAFIEPAR
jgi:hypothetical protein